MTAASPLYDPLVELSHLSDAIEKSVAPTFKTAGELHAWQEATRPKLAKLLGFLDEPAVDLRPREIEAVDRGAFVRRKIVLRTAVDSEMPLYLLEPKDAPRPMPCVLALHGHGSGAKSIVGLNEDGSERAATEPVHADFAVELAKRGFLVAAPEISCFGERQGDYSHLSGQVPRTCHNVNTWAMMLGKSAAGMRVRDGMRVVDYLQTLPNADVSRLGAMGISGGGQHAFLSTALDLRIKAVVISAYFCDWRHSILAMQHCTCNFVPGLLTLGELSDQAAMIAPRACLVSHGMHDPIFPFAHVKETVAKAAKAWDLLGKPENFQTAFFDGGHRLEGPPAYDFLAAQLGAGK